ncbi:MAG: hypothetical protein KBG82_03305 [Spirochaetes bacterium]|nr:hypothetical protein [Spirochaetota bacterium]
MLEDKDINTLSRIMKTNGCLLDASTIIYLDKVDILELLCSNYKIKTIENVMKEICANSNHRLKKEETLCKIDITDPTSTLIENSSIYQGNLQLMLSTNKKISNLDSFLKCNSLSPTDFDLFLTGVTVNLPIFTEDKKIIKLCEKCKISFYNSLIALVVLTFDGLIDHSDAISIMFKINSIAWYSNKIFNSAFELLELVIKK